MRNLVLALLLLVYACATPRVTPGVDSYAPGFAGIGPETAVVLTPFLHAPPEFARGETAFLENLEALLRTRGFQVHQMEREPFLASWNTIVGEIGGLYSSETGELSPTRLTAAKGKLLGTIRRKFPSSRVLMPDLVHRIADLRNGIARWDSVSRRQLQRRGTTVASYASGTAMGTSLILTCFGPNGEWEATTLGGVELLHIVDFGEGTSEPREDLFAEHKVEEASSIALEQLLSPPTR